MKKDKPIKIVKKIPMGQTAYRFKLKNNLVKALNNKMDEEIKSNTFEDASKQLSAKIKDEYRIMNWMEEIDTEQFFIKTIQAVIKESIMYNSFDTKTVTIENAWINDQKEHEYQVVHKHSGQSLIGFASICYLKVPDFGPEINNEHQPHNGRTMLLGNCQGQFVRKNLMLEPTVGDFYIFPYDVEHLVYPFTGDGLRRTLSINYDVHLTPRKGKTYIKQFK